MPNAVVMKQRGLICRQVLQGSTLFYVYIAEVSVSSACGWCATSNPSPGYQAGVKGDLCAGFIFQSGQGKARSEWWWSGWGRRIHSCTPSHGWGHLLLERAVWMGIQPWDPLVNLILKGSGSLEDLHQRLALDLTPAVSAVVRYMLYWIKVFGRVSWRWRHPQALMALISLTWDHSAHGPGPCFSPWGCQSLL